MLQVALALARFGGLNAMMRETPCLGHNKHYVKHQLLLLYALWCNWFEVWIWSPVAGSAVGGHYYTRATGKMKVSVRGVSSLGWPSVVGVTTEGLFPGVAGTWGAETWQGFLGFTGTWNTPNPNLGQVLLTYYCWSPPSPFLILFLFPHILDLKFWMSFWIVPYGSILGLAVPNQSVIVSRLVASPHAIHIA